MFINSSLSEILTLVVTSDTGEVDSASADRTCHALGLSPNPNLDFQMSFPRVLAHKPPRLGTQDSHHRPLPALQKETVCYELHKTP